MEVLSLQVSPSLLHNNLVTSVHTLAYVSNVKPNPQIILISTDSISSKSLTTSTVKYKSEEEVLSINYIELNTHYYLILGFSQALQVWNAEGSRMLGHVSKDDITSADSETFFIGSCAVESMQSIAIGSSKGCISLISPSSDYLFTVRSTYFSRIQEPVSCLCSYNTKVLAFHENGQGSFFDLTQNGQVSIVEGPKVSATASVVVKKYGCVTFGNGEIRVFNMKDESLLAVVWAHSRWITGISKHLTRPIFVTCSEDCSFTAWAVRNRKVELVCSKEISNTLLTGICFDGDRVLIAGYDKTKLIIESLVYLRDMILRNNFEASFEEFFSEGF
jgi:hypothetical protein